MDEILQNLIDALAALILLAIDKLAADLSKTQDWQSEMERLLARYMLAAYMAGNESEVVTQAAIEAAIEPALTLQISYLQRFTLKIQSATEFDAFWRLRAKAYAASIKVPYWSGKTKLLPLPAMPAQGTQCLNNCKCLWRIETLNAEAGDYDAYWERHADDSCQTCIQRAVEWNPVHIRGGKLELT